MGYSDPPGLNIMTRDILFEKSPKLRPVGYDTSQLSEHAEVIPREILEC
jgi:hypothetical protein